MSLTKVTPAVIAVTNNITSNTFGSANTIPSFQIDGSGVIVAASNTAISLTANSVANNQFQTGSVENYLNAQSGGALSGRNRIINGGMVIDQRNSGASLTTTTNPTYTLDRWYAEPSQSSKFSVQRDSSANTVAGFTSSLKVTSLSAYSITSGDYNFITQTIEGFNFADIGWGTSNNQPVTVSFWVRSSLTGTFGFSFEGVSQSYATTYTILAADTWEKKIITVPGTSSGTFYTNNSYGVYVRFNLGTGSTLSGTANTWTSGRSLAPTGATSVVGTNGATWYVTGVQVEKGSIATPFEYRQYGTEFNLCQRYYEVMLGDSAGVGVWGHSQGGTNDGRGDWIYRVAKRVQPTVTKGSAASWVNSTPTIYAGLYKTHFYSTSYFYSATGTNVVSLIADAE